MLRTVTAFLVLLAVAASPMQAQSQGKSTKGPDDWKFTLAPYVMLPWMDGTTALRGREVTIDISPSQIFANLQFGAMGSFEARKGRWGIAFDGAYMALGTDVARPSANVDFNQGAYTFMGLRRLNDSVDLVFGARWNVLQGKLEFKGPLLTGTFEQTKQWVDPIVGLKLKHRIAGPMRFSLQADIGGFGAGSDFAWQLFPVVGFDAGKRATIGVGYRVLSGDYATGSGNQQFKYDVVTQAFVIGMALSY